jgi:hypothetical protein
MTEDNGQNALVSAHSGRFLCEAITLQARDDLPYLFELEPDERLDFIVSSDLPIDLMLCNFEDFEHWADSGYDPDIEVPIYCEYENVTVRTVAFKAPQRGEYAVVLMNWGDRATDVLIEIPDHTVSALR